MKWLLFSRCGGSPGTRFGILGVMAFLLAAVGYTSVLIVQHQAALRDAARYDATWSVNRAALEAARLHAVVAAALVPGSGTEEDDVDLWLEIVAGRVRHLESGELTRLLADLPDFEATMRAFRAAAVAARAALDSSSTDRLRPVLPALSALVPALARLTASANTRGAELAGADERRLRRLNWTFAGLLGSVTLCGFGLVGVLTWRNRQLARAEEEAQQRNEALQTRDWELNVQNARFDAALNNMSQALLMLDARQRVIVCNVRFLELFGVAAEDAQPGAEGPEVFKAVLAAGRYDDAMLRAMAGRQMREAKALQPCNFAVEDATGRALEVSQESMAGGGWVATFEDITERRQAEARISYLAHHDALTDLPNRLSFQAEVGAALKRHESGGEPVAILLLDLDQFKQVNDTLGHPTGDALLQAVAVRLRACVRGGDLVVRLGGDEFAVLQAGPAQPEAAQALAARIVDELERPHSLDGHRVSVGTSIGIAVAAPGLHAADALLKCADIALYCAKAEGRGTFRTFESAMDARMQARREIEADLREALARDELEVFYQPLHNVAAGRVTGFEALLRWRHPVRGLVSPATFIPVAEEIGLIVPFGEWVLAQACADAAAWPDGLKVAVNLSPLQFRSSGLVAAVRQALARSGLSPSRLELEITESALMEDSAAVLATLHELEALGPCIALDDFGTGYSSLSYLRSFPFGKLKIDRAFIQDIATRPECEAIVRSVAGLAHTLGMTTTAEGVETEAQFARLRDVGCTEVQGYLFDRPRPVLEIARWFPSRKPHWPLGTERAQAA